MQPAVITQSAYLLIAAGAFIFIVSFLGYCGAVKESRVLLGLVRIIFNWWICSFISYHLFLRFIVSLYIVRRVRFGDCGPGDHRRKSGSNVPTGGNISLAISFSAYWINLLIGRRLKRKLNRTWWLHWRNITALNRKPMLWRLRGTWCKYGSTA